MLRLLMLAVAMVVLASLLPATPKASALPADTPDQECLGPLRSSIARGAAEGRTRRDEQGGTIVLPAHFNGDFNPGNFRGTSGEAEFLTFLGFDELHVQHRGCFFPLPDLTSCIDFDLPDRCGDPDDDDYWNQQEWDAGSDPNDPSSTPEYALLDEQTGSNTCGDRLDNDLDGHTDNGDAGCRLTCDDFGHSDRCADPDGDGWLTYVEEMWGSDPNDASSSPDNAGDCIDFQNEFVCEPF